MKNLGTRARVTLLVVLFAIPALGLEIFNALEERAAAEASARDDLQRHARLAAEKLEQTVEGARQLLFALSGSAPALMRDARGCHEYFQRLIAASEGLYHSMGIHRANGDQLCDSVGWQKPMNASDRYYFRAAVESGRFSVGEYQVGRATGLQGINFGLPVPGAGGRTIGVVFAGLDLERFNDLAAATPHPPGAVVTILDRNGIILAQHPAYTASIGEKGPNPRILEVIVGARRGVFDGTDARGSARLFAFESVGENPDGGVPLRIVVGMPLQAIYAELNSSFLTSLGGLAVATVLLLFGAWYGSEHFVLRNLRKLLDVAQRVRAGDLAARTGLVAGREEIAQLGNAFDEMAQSLQDREARLQQALREARELAITDPLTGLYNRRYLWELLRRELLKARRDKTTIAAVLMDIDHFKRFNDTWGHEAGDLVLKEVAKVLRENVRGSDIACRYGGEELAVVLPGATLEVAIKRAEAIRRGISALQLDCDGKPLDAVTASFGVAVFPQHAEDAETLLRAADEALYEAKKSGRNRVAVAGKTLPAAA